MKLFLKFEILVRRALKSEYLLSYFIRTYKYKLAEWLVVVAVKSVAMARNCTVHVRG